MRKRSRYGHCFQHFFKDELELGTLRTVAIMIFTIITYFRHSIAEHTLRTLNLTGDFRKISQFQRSTVLLYDIHHVDVIDNQGTVFNPEFSCGKRMSVRPGRYTYSSSFKKLLKFQKKSIIHKIARIRHPGIAENSPVTEIGCKYKFSVSI